MGVGRTEREHKEGKRTESWWHDHEKSWKKTRSLLTAYRWRKPTSFYVLSQLGLKQGMIVFEQNSSLNGRGQAEGNGEKGRWNRRGEVKT